MKPTRRQLSGALLLGLVLLVVVFAAIRISERLRPTEAKPEPVPSVRVERLQPRTFVIERRYTGTIESVRRSRIAAQLSARVTAVLHREGEWVGENDILIRLDETETAEEVQRLEAAGARIRADLAFWRRQLERDRELLQKSLISSKQRDESRRMVETLEASLRENGHALDAARTRLGYAVVRAPFAGRIQSLSVETGELAVPGRQLVELVAREPLKAVITVPQRDMDRLAEGQPVRLALPVREFGWEARVARIYPAVDPATRNARFEASVPSARKDILPGMAVTATVTLATFDDAITVPHEALRRRREGQGIFVVERQTAHWRKVDPGPTREGRILIHEGLSAGETIVVTPDPRLRDGGRVVIADGAPR